MGVMKDIDIGVNEMLEKVDECLKNKNDIYKAAFMYALVLKLSIKEKLLRDKITRERKNNTVQ